MKYRLTTVETVHEVGAWICTVQDSDGEKQEVVLVPCAGERPVEAWINRCTHEDQRLYRVDVGVVMREGHIVCPKHGSSFDACDGGCDNGPAAGTSLWEVDVTVENGDVYLTDSDYRYRHDGPSKDDDDEPSSTSHLRF